jgi:hypothetical protein
MERGKAIDAVKLEEKLKEKERMACSYEIEF